MKLAFILPSLKKSGPVNLAMEIIQHLRINHQVDVFFFDDLHNSFSIEGCVKISFFQKIKGDYDAYHSHGLRPDLYTAFHGFGRKATTVSTMHNIIPEELSFIYPKYIVKSASFLWKKALSRLTHVVAISPYMKEWYVDWGLKNLIYIPNTRSISNENYNKEINQSIVDFKGTNVLIMTIGQMIPRKNLHHILGLLSIREDLKWVHLGAGTLLDSLKNEVESMQMKSRVLFLGQVSEAQLYLNASDIMVLCSSSEGFPLVVLEAIAQNVPVICNKIPHYKGLFTEEEVLTCDTSKSQEFSKSIDLVLKDKNDRVIKARQKYLDKYAPEIVCKQYELLYQS